MTHSILSKIVTAQKQGEAKGIYAICSANSFVLEAGFQQALADNSPLLIESTCNQVNQFGGYTGMTPKKFVAYVKDMAQTHHFPLDRLILGGDHLGPSVWQNEAAATAMAKSKTLIRHYIAAGYTKIHLDASMKCADDAPDRPLNKTLSAARAAELCLTAEETLAQLPSNAPRPRYVIGTEVPVPGGEQEATTEMTVSSAADTEETINITRNEFLKRGLEDAWDRVIAVVVQPGVEFGDEALFEYNPAQTAKLSRFIRQYNHLVYEAHSTDYQTQTALRNLVKDHFAILKVGPALTFAFREAIFALAMIEEEWLGKRTDAQLSDVRQRLEEAMLAHPVYWQKYYFGNQAERHFARRYSFSDRIRYYWTVPAVNAALTRLLDNLSDKPIPASLLSQYLPVQYKRIRAGTLKNSPQACIYNKVADVLADYSAACGY